MNSVLSTTEMMLQLGHLQDITQQFEQPWKLETYSSLADLYRIPDYLDGTRFLRPDTEDGAEDVTESLFWTSTHEEKKREKTSYSTGSVDINKEKHKFINR